MSKKVLIVDDSEMMRRMVAFTLQSSGYDTLEGATGQEGLDLLEKDKVDLIVADVNMPVMDGISFVKLARQREDCKRVPILMLTTENMATRVQEGRQAGATGWLVKPFKPERLLDVVRKVVP
ncbi:MAG: response regulator [Bryobacteraceae bacterium]